MKPLPQEWIKNYGVNIISSQRKLYDDGMEVA